MSMLAVYWLFFQFGLLCFGGGYVLVPLIIANIVENPDFYQLLSFNHTCCYNRVIRAPILLRRLSMS